MYVNQSRNLDRHVVAGFGDEWTRFDQSDLNPDERAELFNSYFAIFPWEALPADPAGFDLGCGTGRWAQEVAPRVGHLHCIDASEAALGVARGNLADRPNCSFRCESVDEMSLPDGSCDFGYSLGVLHHIPDTQAGINACVRKLKPGAPFLIYLYYAFDNRPAWFRGLWRGSELLRGTISRAPHALRYAASQVLAGLVYWPLARTARLLERCGASVDSFPLSVYRHRSFYVMRTDALDRFGTRLERRFTRAQIRDMLERAGLENIRFSEGAPYWCAVGTRKPE